MGNHEIPTCPLNILYDILPTGYTKCHVVKTVTSKDNSKLYHSEHYLIRGKDYHPLLPDKQALFV
jgi:hypothetical protein